MSNCDRCGEPIPPGEGGVFVPVDYDRPGDPYDPATGRTIRRDDLVGPCCDPSIASARFLEGT